MRTSKYSSRALETLLRKEKIATLDQLQAALGNSARCTIFRKLGELEYLSSYSHRGKYYTLKSIVRFDAHGLWNFRSVRFSRFGNLLETAEALVQESQAGYTSGELRNILHVKTKHALTQLYRTGRLQREEWGAQYLYLAASPNKKDQQRKKRNIQERQSSATIMVTNPDLAVEEAKAVILLFASLLTEKQRRLYAGLESLKLGHGGDEHIAALLGMDSHTVARGRRELLENDLQTDSIRASGGGRPEVEKKTPKS